MCTQIPSIARRRQAHCLIAGLLLLHVLGGCSGNGDNSGVAQPLVGHAGAATLHGRFVGTVKIDGVDYFADAIVAPDGRTYVYIGDPHADIDVIQMTSPKSSIHFVGTVVTRGSELTGPGRVIKPNSASSASIRLDRSANGESGAVYGEIIVNHDGWLLDLVPWNRFLQSTGPTKRSAGTLFRGGRAVCRRQYDRENRSGRARILFRAPFVHR